MGAEDSSHLPSTRTVSSAASRRFPILSSTFYSPSTMGPTTCTERVLRAARAVFFFFAIRCQVDNGVNPTKVLRREKSLEQRSILQREELRASEGGGFFCNFYDCACLLGEPTSRRGVHFRRRTRRHPSRAGMYRILKPARVSATTERVAGGL